LARFGHRASCFRCLPHQALIAFIIGGLIWYAWHWPLVLVIPQTVVYPLWQAALNWIVLAVGSVCTFTYLAYVYVKMARVYRYRRAHHDEQRQPIVVHFAILQDQVLANVGLTLTILLVVAFLRYRGEFGVRGYFSRRAQSLKGPEISDSSASSLPSTR
jgi:hypothetical protein